MANKPHRSGRTLLALPAILLVAVIIVQTGGWKNFYDFFHIGNATTDTTSIYNHDTRQPFTWKSIEKFLGAPPVEGKGQPAVPAQPAQPGQPAQPTQPAQPGSPVALPAASQPAHDYPTLTQWAETLPTRTPQPKGYNRANQFGGWKQATPACGDASTRDMILARDLTNVRKNPHCQVMSGQFTDPYTGKRMHFQRGINTSSLIQIDHVVALQDAWASGANRWTQARRVAYANDPDVLLASEGKANMEKGAGMNWKNDTNPVWLPANRAYRCAYMGKRVEIKHKYGLSMSQGERKQTVEVLRTCAR